jgi:DNA-binding FadR family transcriptional regulator
MAQPALTTAAARALFTPLDEGGRAGTVARRLAKAIGLGLLLDGERLPAESVLAGQLGVSPVTLREALATLRTMGLVETRRGRGGGSFVRVPPGPGGSGLERPLRELSLDALRDLSVHELQDIGDHRAAISGAAARLAAQRALPPDVSALTEHAARLAGAASLTSRRRADARFHIEVAAAAQSPRLTSEEMSLWSQIGDLVWLPMSEADLATAAGEHTALIAAIARRDPAAARDIAEHHVQAETARLLALRLSLCGQ